MAKRTIVYIDGFNLYYGALKDGPYKWLDLQSFFTKLRPADDLKMVRYFTALIDGSRLPNQKTYLRALDTLPLVQVVLGKYKYKPIVCRVANCDAKGNRTFMVPEEKRTDVNLATHLLDDAFQDLFDIAVLVSGDSDLVPGLQFVKLRFPHKRLFVYVPSRDPRRGAAVELRAAADKHKTLPLDLLKQSQFPATLQDGAGGTIQKPAGW